MFLLSLVAPYSLAVDTELDSMKRISGFRIVALEPGQWNVTTKAGQWQLPLDRVPRTLPIEMSWHRTWNQAVAAYSEVSRSGKPDEVIVVAAKKRIVLAVLGKDALESQFLDADGDSLWKSTLLKAPKLVETTQDSPVYFNYNQMEIAWVTLSGAEKDVPYKLNFLERRARKNPDSLYGRLVARGNELRDYFRPG